MPGLRVKDGKVWQELPITERSFIIGRAGDCDHVIESGFISRHHCKITLEADGYFLVDLGSSLGTTVNGKDIKRARLAFGDRIRLADRWDAIFVGEAESAFTETMAAVSADGLLHRRRLVALDGEFAGAAFPLQGELVRMGRHEENDISIPAETVSSFHAQLNFESGDWSIADLRSSNGTFVNDTRIHRRLLRNGDLIRIDRFNFRFEDLPMLAAQAGPAAGEIPVRPLPELSLARPAPIDAPEDRQAGRPRGKVRLGLVIALLVFIALSLALVCFLLWREGLLNLARLPAEPGPAPVNLTGPPDLPTAVGFAASRTH